MTPRRKGGRLGPRSVRRVGIVGCGRMGGAIGRHLLAGGWPLTVTDVDPAAQTSLVTLGATGVAGPGEVAAASDLVLVIVVDDEQVLQAFEARGGILEAAEAGSIVAISASVRPDSCRMLAEMGDAAQIHVIDAALVRGERGAEAGELLLLCGGAEEVIDACRPAFAAFAADVRRVGEVGAGQAAKIVHNILLWSCLRADVEALRLGRALGVAPADLRSALSVGSGSNRPLEEWGQHRLRWPEKDLEMALVLAAELHVELEMVRALAPLMTPLTPEDLRDLM